MGPGGGGDKWESKMRVSDEVKVNGTGFGLRDEDE